MTDAAASQLDTLARLDAESAIHRLLAVYCHILDDGLFDDLAELFRHGAIESMGATGAGFEAARQFFNGVQLHADGTPRTWHTLSNILIEVDPSGETASASSYFTVHQQLEGFPLQPICAGRYLDKFEKHEGQWRFTNRLLKPRLFGDLRFHVAGALDMSKL